MKGLYEKRGWWYYRPETLPGQARAKSVALRTRDEVAATNEAAKMQMESFNWKMAVTGTVEEVLPIYYKARAEDSKATRNAREVILSGFKEILGNPKVSEITPEMIANWREHLGTKGGRTSSKKGVSPATKRSYLITVKAFVNWCRAQGMIRNDPLREVRKLTNVYVTRQAAFLTVEQRDRLLELPCRDYVKLILHLGFFAGLRHGEMLALHPGWIWISPEGDRGTITVQATNIEFDNGTKGVWLPKGKKSRMIPMHPRLLEVVKNHGMRKPYMLAPDRPLWPADEKKSTRFDPKKALANLATAAGIPKLTYHMLRHSFATHLAQKGRTMKEIASLLGDGLVVTEKHYVGFAPNSADVLAAL